MSDSSEAGSEGMVTVARAVQKVNTVNTGVSIGSNADQVQANESSIPVQYALGLASQPIAQSMAILVQDATDLFRNVSTVETTAIGTATAKWIAEPPNVAYKEIIETSTAVIKDIAEIVGQVGTVASGVLADFEKIDK